MRPEYCPWSMLRSKNWRTIYWLNCCVTAPAKGWLRWNWECPRARDRPGPPSGAGTANLFFFSFELFPTRGVLPVTAVMAPIPGVVQGKHPASDNAAMRVVPDLSGSFFRRLSAGVFLSAPECFQCFQQGGFGLGSRQSCHQDAVGIHNQSGG